MNHWASFKYMRCILTHKTINYPQIRAEELHDGVDYPVDLTECRFQVVQQHKYVEQAKFTAELARNGLASMEEQENGISASILFEPRQASEKSTHQGGYIYIVVHSMCL